MQPKSSSGTEINENEKLGAALTLEKENLEENINARTRELTLCPRGTGSRSM